MFRMEQLGATGYGGAVTIAELWDNKRITEGKLKKDEILKKAGFYTYMGIGLAATLSSVFGWWKKGERWTEAVSTGFFYDLPRVGLKVFKDLEKPKATSTTVSDAIRQANEIVRRSAATKLNSNVLALTQGDLGSQGLSAVGVTDEVVSRRGM